MSRRQKYILILFVYFPVGGGVIMTAAFRYADAIALLCFVWLFIIKWLVETVLCRKCGYPVGKSKFNFLGMSLTWWKPIPPARCAQCGAPHALKTTKATKATKGSE